MVDGAQDSGSAARSSAADVMATSELGGPGNPTPGGLSVWLKQGTETAKQYSVIFGNIRYHSVVVFHEFDVVSVPESKTEQPSAFILGRSWDDHSNRISMLDRLDQNVVL